MTKQDKMRRLITVLVRPNAQPEYGLLDTDGGLNASVTRTAVKQGVGELLRHYMPEGGSVVILDRKTNDELVEVTVKHTKATEPRSIQPKYRLGSMVFHPKSGRNGHVMLYKPYPTPMYFIDLYPGASGEYEYIYIMQDGKEYCCPGNWLPEEEIEPDET